MFHLGKNHCEKKRLWYKDKQITDTKILKMSEIPRE